MKNIYNTFYYLRFILKRNHRFLHLLFKNVDEIYI